jgi:hypothetical protein
MYYLLFEKLVAFFGELIRATGALIIVLDRATIKKIKNASIMYFK